MANKEDKTIALPDDIGGSFDEERRILTYKPSIEYEEPPQEDIDYGVADPETSEIEDARKRTESIIENYKSINQLTNIAQGRIDSRIEAGGGFEINLDPARDAQVVSALKRCFPEAKDHSKISYEMYKQCLMRMNKAAGSTPGISPADVQTAKEDPLRTNFGGIGSPPGMNRTEISSPASNVAPIDLAAFQAAGVLALFQLLYPLIKKEDKEEILQHLATAPHKPI